MDVASELWSNGRSEDRHFNRAEPPPPEAGCARAMSSSSGRLPLALSRRPVAWRWGYRWRSVPLSLHGPESRRGGWRFAGPAGC
jgi:hypothetical protein